MIFKKLFLSLSFLFLLFGLTGCTIPFTDKVITLPFFEKSPEVALEKMREKMDSVSYYKSDVDFSLNIKTNSDKIKDINDLDPSSDDFGDLESISPGGMGGMGLLNSDLVEDYFKDLTLNLKIKNQIDQKEKDNKKQRNDIDLGILFGNGKWNFNFSSINLEDKQYLRINEVPMMVAMLLGQFAGEEVYNNWIDVDFTKGVDTGEVFPMGSMFYNGITDYFLLEPENKKELHTEEILEKYKKYNLFKVKKRLSDESIDDNKCYHYKIEINEEEFKSFFYEVNNFVKESESDLEEINKDEIINKVLKITKQLDIDLWVDKENFYLRKIDFSLSLDPSQLEIDDLDVPEGAVSIELKGETRYYDFNKPVNIEEPENSKSISSIIEEQAKKAKEELERARVQARSSRTLADVKQIQTALELYYSDVGEYPHFIEPGSEIISPEHGYALMNEVPSIPYGDGGSICSPDFDYVYGVNKEKDNYQIIYCLEADMNNFSPGYYVVRNTNFGSINYNGGESLNSDEITQVLSDFDDDGLCNYIEEEVYKTDPMKKDTDGDGYDDKEELKNGYNPNGEGEF